MSTVIAELREALEKLAPGAPPPLEPQCLQGESLIGENLAGLDLSGWNLTGADLSRADLSGARLAGTVLRGATLFEADLSGAELVNADLSGADLTRCNAKGCGLGSALLEGATLCEAVLTGATLTRARLSRADLRRADLSGARLLEADLRETEFAGAQVTDADMRRSDVTGASFVHADLRATRLQGLIGYTSTDWVGADIATTDFTGAFLVRRVIADQNYLHEFRSQNKGSAALYWAWWITSDCGRSFVRWGLWTVFIAVVFGGLFQLTAVDYGDHPTVLSSLYYSIVTLTTLGYGDVVPASLAAQTLAVVEVIIGYVMLGGLLSIFSNKMARRAD